MLWLTAAELAEINEAIRDLFTRGMERHDDPGARPEDARLCALMAWGVPPTASVRPPGARMRKAFAQKGFGRLSPASRPACSVTR